MKRALKIILFSSFFLMGTHKIWANSFYTSVVATNKGILLGEMDTSLWLNPLNAIYLSEDLGETWEPLGLEERGILDIHYQKGVIFATTFFVKDNVQGLFASEDFGKTWKNTMSQFSPTKVSADEHGIYLGSAHCGLWVSFDKGDSWVQKIGTGCSEKEIKEVHSIENVTYVATSGNVYKTTNGGQSFSVDNYLSNKSMYSFAEDDKYIYAGSNYNWGLHRTPKSEEKWEKVADFNINCLHTFNGVLYASKFSNQTGKHELVASYDRGANWESVAQIPDHGKSLAGIVSDKTYLLATAGIGGLVKHPHQPEILMDQFMVPPWSTGFVGELVDKISAFFDHSYPLLGYSAHQEPEIEKGTTFNFLGIKGKKPNVYYSSHSGTDFYLKYGTPIKAVFGGTATYTTCEGCGHTIRIDHLNGYTSIYMHLQEEGLVTKREPVNVSLGETIGKVGMTGNTTGPHLHLEVQKSNTQFPDKRVDPFGWQADALKDSWESYTWKDNYGDHRGSVSKYLWVEEIIKNYKHIIDDSCLSMDNKEVCFNKSPDETSFNVTLRPHAHPLNTKGLHYVPNTSLLVTATSILGEDIKAFNQPMLFTFKYIKELLGNILEESLSIYYKNEESGEWIKIPSVVDLVNKTVRAYVNHLTWFALFGETETSEIPEALLTATGTQENGWYNNFVDVVLTTNKTAFYSIGKEDLWNEYKTPINISIPGVHLLQYRSLDTETGEAGETQEQILKIKGEGWVTRAVVKGSIFVVNIQ